MSNFLEIRGGIPLNGSVRIGGAKNAALPLLMASLLTAERCVFSNIPQLEDINIALRLLENFGCVVEKDNGHLNVTTSRLVATEASYSLVKSLRASFWILGPLLARGRAARVALPGGDLIGARPVDMHLAGLVSMGADIKVKHGVVLASALQGLRPATIDFRFPSVGATHQIVMAAALTPGTTVIRGAAREPEITALGQMINGMGGDVEGAGTSEVIIRGKESLGGVDVEIIGDRIEAGTYLLAGIATHGSVRAEGIDPSHLGAFLEVLSELGADVSTEQNAVTVRQSGDIRAVSLATAPFPGIATDLQAQLVATLTLANGKSRIEENIFEGRFGHVSELCRLGADIIVEDRAAVVTGVSKLTGAPVEGHDIRGAASLVVAGLVASGVTEIFEPQHLRRGYEHLESKLASLGARVGYKVSDPEDFVFTGC